MQVVDTATNAVVKTIPVGARPRSVAFSPDGTHAYVTAEVGKSVSVLDGEHNSLLTTVHLTGEVLPMGIVVSPDSRRIYVTTGRRGTLVAMDTESMRPVQSTAVGRRPWGVAISPDGATIFTANGPSDDVTVTDAQTMKVIAKIAAGHRPWGALAR